MTYIYDYISYHVETAYVTHGMHSRKINMIKYLRSNIKGLSIKNSKDLADWYIGYRKTNDGIYEVGFGFRCPVRDSIMKKIEDLAEGNIRFPDSEWYGPRSIAKKLADTAQEVSLGDILSNVLKSSALSYTLIYIDMTGINQTYNAETLEEANRVKMLLTSLDHSADLYKKIS